MEHLKKKSKIHIRVDRVFKSYGDRSILRGLQLEVERAETLVILGRSGAGKSVLLRLIMGLEPCDQGAIYVDGQNIDEHQRTKSKKKSVNISSRGMLFQSAALFDSMTVGENIAFALKSPLARRHLGILSEKKIRQEVERSLAAVGLKDHGNFLPSNLSGGMRKRAGLARLIAIRPQILLYDEPTTGLDPITAMQINKLIKETQESLGATSIVVTHDLESALTVGDRFALHDGGQIISCECKLRFISSPHPTAQAFLKSRHEVNARYFSQDLKSASQHKEP